MKKGKRVLLLAAMICGLCVLAACGCGRENTNETTTGTTDTATTTNGTSQEMTSTEKTTTNGTNTTGTGDENQSQTTETDETKNGNGVGNDATNDDGVIGNIGDDMMEGVDDLATDIGLDGNRGDGETTSAATTTESAESGTSR